MADQSNSKKASALEKSNFLKSTIMNIKLITRLMSDSRVNGLIKLLPIGSLIYLISPIDFISGALMPVIGAADDIAIVWFGLHLFLELCPAGVVDEHLAQITGQSTSTEKGDIIDAEVVDLED